jgi:hypothetical protein
MTTIQTNWSRKLASLGQRITHVIHNSPACKTKDTNLDLYKEIHEVIIAGDWYNELTKEL